MNLSLFKWIWLSIVGVTAAAVVAMYVALQASLVSIVDQAEVSQLNQYYKLLSDRMHQEVRLGSSLARLVAAQPSVQAAFAAHDREALAREFLPPFRDLAKFAGVSQFQFHLPPATSFLRLHRPEKFGDDLSSLRATVMEGNAQRHMVQGLETGREGLGIRSVAPVEKDGIHIGTVEFGMKFDDTFFSRFKADNGADVVFQLADGKGGYTTFADTRAAKTPLPAEAVAAAMAGKADIRTFDAGAASLALLTRAVADYSGKAIGAVTVVMDASPFVQERTAATQRSLAAAAAVFVLATLVSMRVASSIVRPIRSMVGAMQKLAHDDTAIEVPYQDRKNEIGLIAAAIEVWRNNAIARRTLQEEAEKERAARERRAVAIAEMTREFDRKVSDVLEVVGKACVEMDETAQSLSASAEQTSRQSQAVAAATEQASASVQTVASAAEQLSASIAEIAHQVEQSNGASREAAGEARRSDAIVKELAESSAHIGDVVNLITDIANQTNLLALNATIEAARAGEAGKGFAVVAGEVKNLASQTAKATEEIGRQIAGIQEATEHVVAAIASIVSRITEVNDVSAAIAAAVEEQSAAAREIARNVAQAAAGTQEVATNIVGVNQTAGETGAASRQVLSASQSLAREAGTLRSVVETFLQGVRTA